MNARRLGAGAVAVTLVLAAIGASWAVTRQQSESLSATPPEDTTTISERTTSSNTKPRTTSLPADDVAGRDIPDLPRYPGSVRVEYERKAQDLLVFTRVSHLSRAKLDVVRGFYRGVFRGQGWKVANAEFSEGEWTFLVVDGEREADIEIEPHGRDVTRVDILVSEPLPEKESAPKEIPQKREGGSANQEPAPPQPPPTATPIPAPAPQTAPAPDDGEGEDDLGDDRADEVGNDDEGGDD